MTLEQQKFAAKKKSKILNLKSDKYVHFYSTFSPGSSRDMGSSSESSLVTQKAILTDPKDRAQTKGSTFSHGS